MTQEECAIACSKAYEEGIRTQMHRIEKLVKDHLIEAVTLPNDYFKTELEKVQNSITRQFIDAVKLEAESIKGFSSIYLKRG